jgi:hypothetical protein
MSWNSLNATRLPHMTTYSVAYENPAGITPSRVRFVLGLVTRYAALASSIRSLLRSLASASFSIWRTLSRLMP